MPTAETNMGLLHHQERIQAYRRDLPGGGFVAIDVQPTHPLWWRQRRYTGQVVVERRSAWREGDHPSPVIASAVGDTIEEVVQVLLPAARCNETIGAALLRIGTDGRVAR
jgi:hypothetical protein